MTEDSQAVKRKKKNRHKKKKRKHTNPQNAEINEQEQNDSDLNDGEPVEKKIKKPKKEIIIPTDSAGKKLKSIRQMKREKYESRQAEITEAARESLKQECQNYLSQWKYSKQTWKFMKAKQLRLYENKFNTKMVTEEMWPTWLEYFNTAAATVKKRLIEEANDIIKRYDEFVEKSEECDEKEAEVEDKEDKSEEKEEIPEEEVKQELVKPDDLTYKRARDIIQCIEEDIS